MPSVRLKTDVGYCDSGGKMIFLDALHDRYFSVTPAIATLVRSVSSGDVLNVAQQNLLLRTGLFEIGETAQASNCAPCNVGVVSVMSAAQHVAKPRLRNGVNWTLATLSLALFHNVARRLPLRRSLALAKALSRSSLARLLLKDPNSILVAFDRALLLFPRKDRCLPDALALYPLLKCQNPATRIVFGVRTDPFQAHCWVQIGAIAIQQDIEVVRSFQPILAIA
ncbi:hypothetical protein CA833_20030 [Novosphingobium sp. KA1]|nr:hypothetical protein CA833_20030 [Novosphingobium sp. KA1]